MTDYERIERVIRYLEEHYREQPSLARLARVVGLSESHFQRLFSRWAGISPKTFLKYLTASHARELLKESRDLLEVSYATGLSGPGRLHDLLVSVDAVTPGEFKSGGEGISIRYGSHETPFGKCLLGVTERGICHFSFYEGDLLEAKKELLQNWPKARLVSDQRRTAETLKRIFSIRRGKKSGKISVLLKGSPFQIKVWEALLKVPSGKLVTYGDIARSLGSPNASRAVGTAIGRNEIAYLIPCHRVIRETAVIGEYRWGSHRKKALIAWESAVNRSTE